ncbi:fluoride efflux transporter CrcB [Tetragenococcus muriaticus]|uniref:fluoride efflux transporter CrcB n=1 Tax=Tetragenococcus muriaticus TaxID=64642 RepID=UPI00041356A9|nr:fluoride efflux transporter CrcB [Tetragenococcus muriaticus]GMA47717.1 putative fluoride ion transporter CrcB 2 [Tetragenococcus muriaticus]
MVVNFLLVSIGAVFGVLARVLSTNWIKKGWRHAFPLATFIINSVGCFFLGLVTGLSLESGFSLLIGTGFMGAFTTFSTFNIESIELLRMKNFKHFFFYTGASYTFGIFASFVGIICGNLI